MRFLAIYFCCDFFLQCGVFCNNLFFFLLYIFSVIEMSRINHKKNTKISMSLLSIRRHMVHFEKRIDFMRKKLIIIQLEQIIAHFLNDCVNKAQLRNEDLDYDHHDVHHQSSISPIVVAF